MKKISALKLAKINRRNRVIGLKIKRRARRLARRLAQRILIDNSLIDFYKNNSSGIRPTYITFKQAQAYLQLPSVLSFLDKPEEALKIMSSICAAQKKRYAVFNINHKKCIDLDLSASAVMDVLMIELRKFWRKNNFPTRIVGQYSDSPLVNEILKGTGLVKHLEIAGEELSAQQKSQYIYFDLHRGEPDSKSPNISSSHEKVTGELVEYLDTCLKTQGLSLSQDGLGAVSNMVGEILANAAEHSGMNKWYVIAYLRQNSISGNQYGECNIAIFSFGKTIYETLSSSDTSEYLKSQLDMLTDMHIKNGYFSDDWNKEQLWTLYSLQEGVSRYTGTPEGRDRGTGTIRMLEFFQKIGRSSASQTPPKMCLISGNTYMLFDGKYEISKRELHGEERQIIAFNKENDLYKRPDPYYLRKLKGRFPGTLISMKFYFDKKYLSTLIGRG